MPTARTMIAVALTVGASIICPPQLAAQSRQHEIYASAVDEKGDAVQGLGPADFVVREDKVTREVLAARHSSDPMQIALLIDNSTAAERFIRDYREALAGFLDIVAADTVKHEVAVITLADRPTISVDYTTDLARAKAATQRVFSMAGSGTYLLDGIIETSNGITKRDAPHPVIVAVISEGPDLSDRVYQAVLEPLKAAGATLHVLIVGRPMNNEIERGIVLDRGSRESGGRYEQVLASSGLPMRLKQLATELTNQYLLTYSRPESLIPPEQITVDSNKPGVNVRGIPKKTPKGQKE